MARGYPPAPYNSRFVNHITGNSLQKLRLPLNALLVPRVSPPLSPRVRHLFFTAAAVQQRMLKRTGFEFPAGQAVPV
jgi:hypothetical protein